MKKRILILASVVLALIALLGIVSCDSRPEYTVTLDLAGGTGVPTEVKVKEGDLLKIDEPTREGYTFNGWFIGKGVKTWKLDTDKVTADISLRASWKKETVAGVCQNGEPHQYEILEDTQPDCTTSGKYKERCIVCYDMGNSTTRKALGHQYNKNVVDPTCGVKGYTEETCLREGCNYYHKYAETQPTGNHAWSGAVLGADGYRITSLPTKYTYGEEEEWCTVCTATRSNAIKALCTDKELAQLIIGNYQYTGGKYTNEPFVNIAGLTGSTVSSYYTVCIGNNAIDGEVSTYWSADTIADGANFTGEWIELKFVREYEVGALNFIMPHYSSWELGDECYVEYKIELLVNGNWETVGTISDKNANAEGVNAAMLLELSEPKLAKGVRATVTHSGRFAPAMIYELEVFAKTEETMRKPLSAVSSATAIVSGKYNEWAQGADALTDGNPNSYWYTNWRHKEEGAKVYADLEFPKDTFIAAIEFTMAHTEKRAVSLQYWVEDGSHADGGYFVEIGQYKADKYGENKYVGVEGVSCQFGTSGEGNTIGFVINAEVTTKKLRLEIINEPQNWTSKIFSFVPYTVKEFAGIYEPTYAECKHANLDKLEVVAPTCINAGYTIMKCNCGYTTRSKATDALGHKWGEYLATVNAEATGVSTRTSTCTECSATRTKQFDNASNNAIVSITQYLKNAPAAWSHTLDDGNYLATYDWAIPVFEKYKFRATVVMSITFSDGVVSEWQEYFSKSSVFDLGSHSYTHGGYYASPTLSESSLLGDVNRAHYWFMNKFKGQKILGFAAPNGQTTEGVADYLAGFYYANRIGDSPVQWYNLPSDLVNRVAWGRLNSYVSKSSQTEGAYTYVKKSDIEALIADVNETTQLNAFINYVFNNETLRLEDNDRYDGTYWYNAETYVYEWLSSGSYNMHIEQETITKEVINEETGEKETVEEIIDKEVYTFVNDNSGEYIMVHSELGSYEKGINTLLDVGGWSIDCVHTLGVTNQIWTSYNSTISKLEYLKKTHIWGASYTDVIQYLREYQNAHVDVTEMTDTVIKISLTDTLDDYMFDHALTVKVDIPDSWTNVTVTQNGVEIPLILDIDEYYDDFARKACTIIDGYLYLDAVPDAGEIVVTVAE